MGDPEGAPHILEEVLNEGSSAKTGSPSACCNPCGVDG